MKALICFFVSVVALGVALADDPAWPADFNEKVAACEAARLSATTVKTVSCASAVSIDPPSGESAFSQAFCGVFVWWVAQTAGIDIDTDARLGFTLTIR